MTGKVHVWEKRMKKWKHPHTGPTPLRDLGLTLITAYCNDIHRFPHMFRVWNKYSEEIKDFLHFLIIDDGSTHPVHWQMMEYSHILNFNLRVLRIKDNLLWNTPGAWNLGFTQTPTEWAINLASDFALEQVNMEKMLELRPVEGKLYKFPRKRVTNDEEIKNKWDRICPHPEVFLMRKTDHMMLGGFDEDFTGAWAPHREDQARPYPGYGIFDNHFTEKVVWSKHHAYGEVVDGPVITEYMEDIFGGSEANRVMDENAIYRNKHIWRDKQDGKMRPYSPMLRFSWEETFSTQRKS
jgi:hypothetical protein